MSDDYKWDDMSFVRNWENRTAPSPSFDTAPVSNMRKKIGRFIQKVRPYAQTAERLAEFSVKLKDLSPIGVIGIVSTAINASSEYFPRQDYSEFVFCTHTFISTDWVVKALEMANVPFTYANKSGEEPIVEVSLMGQKARFSRGVVECTKNDQTLLGHIKSIISNSLPKHLTIIDGFINQYDGMKAPSSAQGDYVLEQVSPFMKNPADKRCILLEGKPGVGKTTIAKYISNKLNLGKVLFIDGGSIYDADKYSNRKHNSGPPSPISIPLVFALLKDYGVSTVIIDDVDKTNISVNIFSCIRDSIKLIILTANNGKYDDVLDNAFMRPGRVDEVFTIKPGNTSRTPPFDRLSDAEWEIISQWPVASRNELALRMERRPYDPRIEEIQERIELRTRSKDFLK